MVDRKRHLGVVPDQEINEASEGQVIVRTASIPELVAWLKRLPDIKTAKFAPIDVAPLQPASRITGEIEQLGTTTLFTSWLKPIREKGFLPAAKIIKADLLSKFNDADPDWVPDRNQAFLVINDPYGRSSLTVNPYSYKIMTDAEMTRRMPLAHRFSTHAKMLQGVLETLFALQEGQTTTRIEPIVLRPMLGSPYSPRPPRLS